MYQVTLEQFPSKIRERVERIVHKHSGGKLDHQQRQALLALVLAGQPQIIARYAEEHVAANVVKECQLLGGSALVGPVEAA